jgi:hypothetical protein
MYKCLTFVAKSSHSQIHPLGKLADSTHSAKDRPFNIQIFEKCTYTAKKVGDFPVPSRDVTKQTRFG